MADVMEGALEVAAQDRLCVTGFICHLGFDAELEHKVLGGKLLSKANYRVGVSRCVVDVSVYTG